jgi:hypothetical protein
LKISLKTGLLIFCWLALLVGVYLLGQTPREFFNQVFLLFSISFAAMILIYQYSKPEINNWYLIFVTGLILRLALINSVPQWSDDYARFLWDGEMISMGHNPYLETPSNWIENNSQDSNAYLNQLFELMNSPDYYSIYPPTNQLLFWIAVKLSNQNLLSGIILLRLLLILAEIGIFIILFKLLRGSSKLILYWLNPFVILEISGNLHFEGLVLLGLLLSLWAYSNNKLLASGSFWSAAIGLKILPLMLLPSFFANKKIRRSFKFWLGAGLIFCISFFPLIYDSSWQNLFKSLQLYQGKFEFNASFYYLMREVGFWIQGYNTIATLTKILSLTTFMGILYMSWKKKNDSVFKMTELWCMIYLVYLLLQPVVHPWYIIPVFGLSLLTNMKSLSVWTFSAIFSYHAYSQVDFIENPWFILLEYLILGIGVAWDLKRGNLNFKTDSNLKYEK